MASGCGRARPQGKRAFDRVGSIDYRYGMARVVIPIFFDYASTLCYIAWRIVRELEPELGFDALWKGVPIALRDFRTKPGRPLGDRERMKIAVTSAESGILVAAPDKWLDSDAALRGGELARDADCFTPYHDGIFRAAFEDRADIGNLEVLSDVANRAAMNREKFIAEISAGAMAERIAANKREADEFTALGYPTFILGDFPLIGIQPIDSMRLLLRRFIEKRTTEPQA